MSSVQDLSAQLNDPGVFGTTAAWLYLYSMADQQPGLRWGVRLKGLRLQIVRTVPW